MIQVELARVTASQESVDLPPTTSSYSHRLYERLCSNRQIRPCVEKVKRCWQFINRPFPPMDRELAQQYYFLSSFMIGSAIVIGTCSTIIMVGGINNNPDTSGGGIALGSFLILSSVLLGATGGVTFRNTYRAERIPDERHPLLPPEQG